MTPPTSLSISSALTSAANTELGNCFRRRYEGMTINERRAMALDDVPAELRRRLSGTIPYAPQHRPRTPEEVEPVPALAENLEDVHIGDDEQVTIDHDSESFGFTIYITLADGFLAAITLTGRSAQIVSLNK